MMRILLVSLALSLVAAWSGTANAQERYAAFVADMQTGEVLHARRADAPRHPASLTKMMTLYMLFEALESGDVTLETDLVFSAEAARRPASKLGLAAGESLRVEDAIRALIVQSANDVAVAVAEHLEGSEPRFANAMTRRANRLGMTQTLFRNASGLPDPRQLTTARDMARLAYALRRDFPQYFHYFNEERFTWRGITHRNHNTLVGDVAGVDGMKTGYIRASGFNLAATVDRQDQRLVAIVMGGATAAVRDAHARELIEAAYTALNARQEGLMLAALESPRLNPVREQKILTAELANTPAQTAMGSAFGAQPVRVELVDQAELAPPSPSARVTHPAPRTLQTVTPPPGWSVQVGAYTSQAAASARLESISMMGLHSLLRDAQARTEPLQRNQRQLWRARFAGLSAGQAQQICDHLEAGGDPCFAVPPAG